MKTPYGFPSETAQERKALRKKKKGLDPVDRAVAIILLIAFKGESV